MAQQKIYDNNRQRQQAYRQRIQNHKDENLALPKEIPRLKKLTRPKRFQIVVTELENLNQEYVNWLEAIPENLAEGALAAQLNETIEQFNEVLSMLADIQLPRGFGR